jgi:hypothetical protein
MFSRYRALGADLPATDRRRAHGLAMEGYFWRFTDPGRGRVIVVLCGLCRDAEGRPWANVALAAHPGGFLRTADLPRAGGDPHELGVWAADAEGRTVLAADIHTVHVDLGDGARLHAELSDGWPTRQALLGGCGPAHLIPGLGQYWDPHLLGADTRGEAELGAETVTLTGARAYAEKNWGRGGFPAHWWWGQAQGFDRGDVCVAFAGGTLSARPPLAASAVVVRLGNQMIRLGNPLLAPAHVHAPRDRWSLQTRGLRWAVELEGSAGPEPAHLLSVPDPAARHSVPAAHEHLAGTLHAVIRRRGRVVFTGESGLAGLESGSAIVTAGKLSLDEHQRRARSGRSA